MGSWFPLHFAFGLRHYFFRLFVLRQSTFLTSFLLSAFLAFFAFYLNLLQMLCNFILSLSLFFVQFILPSLTTDAYLFSSICPLCPAIFCPFCNLFFIQINLILVLQFIFIFLTIYPFKPPFFDFFLNFSFLTIFSRFSHFPHFLFPSLFTPFLSTFFLVNPSIIIFPSSLK